jgi:hypothetical protein
MKEGTPPRRNLHAVPRPIVEERQRGTQRATGEVENRQAMKANPPVNGAFAHAAGLGDHAARCDGQAARVA